MVAGGPPPTSRRDRPPELVVQPDQRLIKSREEAMQFHVAITVRIPHDVDLEKIKQLGVQEHERAAELQRQGKWLHLWRVVGKFANVSIFKVESPAELHEILESLPLHPYMEVEVTALCRHPGSLAEMD
jgi:muconolactone D-isomerase